MQCNAMQCNAQQQNARDMEFDKKRTNTLNKGMDLDEFKRKNERDEQKGNIRTKTVLTEQEVSKNI